jgi:osmoprotectant transport system permease protein
MGEVQMIDFFVKYHGILTEATLQHLKIVSLSIIFSLLLAIVLTILCIYSKTISKLLINLFSVLYSIPSLAMFAMLIPLTGLGETTAILVLIVYNQHFLIRNFVTGLNEVDEAIVDAAIGMGMTKIQLLYKIQLPLSQKALFAGIRLAAVSTIGIATIAASINAGGLGSILFDGLRTMNSIKILWGSLLSAGLAIIINVLLGQIERRLNGKKKI